MQQHVVTTVKKNTGPGGVRLEYRVQYCDFPARRRTVLITSDRGAPVPLVVDAPRLLVCHVSAIKGPPAQMSLKAARVVGDGPLLDSTIKCAPFFSHLILGTNVCMGDVPPHEVEADPFAAFWNSSFEHWVNEFDRNLRELSTMRQATARDLIELAALVECYT